MYIINIINTIINLYYFPLLLNFFHDFLKITFFKKIIFNWRIIALQYCFGFCHTPTWISHRYTYVPSLVNLPSSSHPFPSL